VKCPSPTLNRSKDVYMAMALGIATGVLAFIATIFMAMAGRSGLACIAFALTALSAVGVYSLSEHREACVKQPYRTAWCG